MGINGIKKIGILTHPLRGNYGGVLQAMALSSYLIESGYAVVIINKTPGYKLAKGVALWILERFPLQNIKGIRSAYKQARVNARDVERLLTVSEKVVTKKELEALAIKEKFDAVIVGSDQVWRMSYIDDGFFSAYFLDFVGDNTRKISYAASFGLDYWQDEVYVDEVAELLSRFNAVSVRESSGVNICKDTFGVKECAHVVDPTLLFDSSFYVKTFGLIENANQNKNVMLSYMLDKTAEKSLLVGRLSRALGNYEVDNILGNSGGTLTLTDWLNCFRNSNFVLTDSFHGVVFSILFKKNFYAVVNPERGAERFSSLLTALNLSGRMIVDVDSFDCSSAKTITVDYEDVGVRLASLRRISESFLRSALS